MTRRISGRLFAIGSAALLMVVSAPRVRPHLMWNTTASAPLGLYWIDTGAKPGLGDYAAIRPEPRLAAWLAARGYTSDGALLIKRVAAVAPSQVCRHDATVVVDGRAVAQAAGADRAGRTLPRWRGCRQLAAGERFFLNPAPGSLDSRYFGPLPAHAVLGRAVHLALPGTSP